MKIDNKITFIEPYFLITRNKAHNINICKLNVNLLLIFSVFVLIISEITNIHKNNKISITQIFCG